MQTVAWNTVTGRARGAGRRVVRHITAPGRVLPDWLIIGAQKGGTTSLYDYLVRHPDIGAAGRKEVHFFDDNFDRGVRWYRSFFPLQRERARHEAQTGHRLMTGEATPYYLFHPLAAQRAASVVPAARLIVLLRDPVKRAFSHYVHQHSRGNEPLSFEEAITQEAERLKDQEEQIRQGLANRSLRHQKFSYVARGFYAPQLRRWLEWFPREQMLVLSSERLYREPGAIVDCVLAFLGLRSHSFQTFAVRNPGSYKTGPAPHMVARLRDHFRAPNEELFELIGDDLGWNSDAESNGR